MTFLNMYAQMQTVRSTSKKNILMIVMGVSLHQFYGMPKRVKLFQQRVCETACH